MLDANSDAAVFVLLIVVTIAAYGRLKGFKTQTAILSAVELVGLGFIVFMVFTLFKRGFS